MAQYRKKPVVVEAIQWSRTGDHPKVSLWKDGHGWIKTLEGGHIVTPGDWIIKGVAGEFYPCKPDIFAMTYEPVTGEEVMPSEPNGSAERPRNTAPAGMSAGGGAGWQPIETAPKDRVVDLWSTKGFRYPDALWDVCWGEKCWTNPHNHVSIEEGGPYTHWRYPPEPPAEGSE